MQPAPMPPMGMAIWLVLSPRNSRCGPRRKRSSRDNADGTRVSAIGLPAGAVTAEPIAAEEVVRRKSRRDGFSGGMVMQTGEVYHRDPGPLASRSAPVRSTHRMRRVNEDLARQEHGPLTC